ncbi:MAG: hypothetical protein JOS17DRAFT_91173 [Linnemannia elongata]|nr:MAG: hypothetical protein JOS17DRAFT_91173 [Linnemannia elongata]
MEVPDNEDPLGPRKARPFSLGFGYKEHKKAALAAANASSGSPATAGSPNFSSAASPMTDSSASANFANAQPLGSDVARNMAAFRSHSFSPSQDRPVHIQENMHAPPAPAETLPGAFPNSPVVAPADTPVVARLTTPSVVPVYSTPVASSDNLPTFVRPAESPAAAAHILDSKAVIPAFSTPTLRHSDLPTGVAAPSTVSHPAVKESASASKSTIAAAATAVAAAAAGVLHKLSDHSEPPSVTPGAKETAATTTAPTVQAATRPVKPSTAAALKTPKKDLSLYEEEESTYPRGDEAVKVENPAHPAVVEDVIEVKKLPKEFHSTAVGLKMPKKDLSLYDEEEGTYPRGDENVKQENPAHPAAPEDVIEVNKFPKAALAVPAGMGATLSEHHSTAATLKTPKKDLSLYDEEESTYPRGDEAVTQENPAHPSVVEDIIEVNKFPKEALAAIAAPAVMAATLPEHHSTAAALKLPKKDLSLYDEEESDYPRGDENDQHENPAHPPGVKEIVEVTAVPAASETVFDGTRRSSQSSLKEKVKGAFSGFHMPKMGRKKDEKDAEVETATATTTSNTDVKPAMAGALAVPVAASIAAPLRDTHGM